MSVASDNYSEHPRVRFARPNEQQSQSTGASSQVPKVIVSKPSSKYLNNNSVHNIASAFENAQFASRIQQGNTRNSHSERLNPSNQNDYTHRHQSQSPDPQSPIIIDENDSDHPHSRNELTDNQQSSKKRKKARRSPDRTYRYRPGDSDSEAGEENDKRIRHEKKARLEQENREAKPSNPRRQTRRRQSIQSAASEELNERNEDEGPGINATRSRRVNQPRDHDAGDKHRKDDTSRKKNASDTRNSYHDRTKASERPSIQKFNSHAARKTQPSAAVIHSNREAAQPPEEEVLNQSNDQDLTGTTDSSRLTLRLSGDSYDFAEEERIVKALENQTRQQPPLKASRMNVADSDRAPDSSLDSGSDQHRISNESTRRSDSGMREIEEIVASNRHSAHPNSTRPRILPLPIPPKPKKISPIIEEPAPELAKTPTISPVDGIGTKLVTELNSLCLRFEFLNRFTWLIFLSFILLALIINSIRTSDITWSIFPQFSSFQKARPIYHTPTVEIRNMEELVERLKSLESVVSSLSSEQQSNFKNMQQNLQRDKREFDYKVGRLELKLEEEEKLRGGLADKVQKKVEQGMQVLRTDLEKVITGHRHDHTRLERMKETVDELNRKVSLSEYSNGHSVSREDVKVMIDQWSSKGYVGSVDPDKLKQTVLDVILNQINQETYLTKANFDKLLEGELHAMAVELEQQLDSKLEKLQHGIHSPRSRSRNIDTGSKGGASDQVQELIDKALERYSRDQIGKRDFALHTGGAMVIPQLTSKTYEVSVNSWSQKIIGYITRAPSVLRGRGPVTAISQETGLGMCWPIFGPTGQIGIFLPRKILVTEISIEHIDPSLAYEMDSAPKEIEAWSIDDSKKLLDIVYDISSSKSSRIQSFKIPNKLNYLPNNNNNLKLSSVIDDDLTTNSQQQQQEPSLQDFDPILRQGILFKIKSNHGNPLYTCIYRLRVHGLMESELHSSHSQ